MLSIKENDRLTRVGPGTPMGTLLRRYWYPVAASAALAEEPVKPIKILGESLVLFRDLFPNILRVGWTFQIRVPMDDTHTWHVMYQVYPEPPGAAGTKQEHIPVYEIPLKDEHGQHITDFVLGQDMMAWVTQGPIAERQLERLGESDKGILLYRRLLREQMAIAETGTDPMNVFHDPARNQILHIPVEHDLVEAARARRLSTGQAPYSPLLDQIETQWANAPSAAD